MSTGDFTPPHAIFTLMGLWSVRPSKESIVVGNTALLSGGRIMAELQCVVLAIAINLGHDVFFQTAVY